MPAPARTSKQGLRSIHRRSLLQRRQLVYAWRGSAGFYGPLASAFRRSEFLMWLPVSPLLLRPSCERLQPVKLPRRMPGRAQVWRSGAPRIRELAVWPGGLPVAIKAAVGRQEENRTSGFCRSARTGLAVEVPRYGNLVPRSRNLGSRCEVPKCRHRVPTFRHRCPDLGTACPVKQTVRRRVIPLLTRMTPERDEK